jgi:DNA-binding LacI/PurR family transcriptional regulator
VGKSKATLADVSKLAGVSSATVSRYLNDTGPVSDDVRARLETAIVSLGYEPRKSLASKKSEGSIAVLTGDLSNPFFPEVIRGIQEEADNYEMTLALFNITDHPQRQTRVIQKLTVHSPDGVVVMGTRPLPALLEWQQKQQVPMVVINRSLDLPLVHSIMVDFENALYRATQHLINQNHVRIGYLSAYHTTEIAVARRRGIEQAMADAGLCLLPEMCATVPPGTDADGGYQAMNVLLNRSAEERPTAVLTFNDYIAIGAIHAIHQRGLRVPQDISIIGVDDIFAAPFSYPPLTTIGQPKFRMGVLAVRRLRQILHEEYDPTNNRTVLESPLIVRGSTGLAPVDSR